MSRAVELKLLGQSIWYDNVKRSIIEDGTLKGMIERREIYGVTSNPSIFQEAITRSEDYDNDLQTMSWAGLKPEAIFYRLAIQDIQDVADLFRSYYDGSNGADGFVSLEVNPTLAHDTQGTIDEAAWLWREVDRPNLMIKIPATKAGLPAITQSIAVGINVNVTLIFSRKRYGEVMNAYLEGLEKRVNNGKDLSHISSVASFFVSRLETKVDDRLQRLIESGEHVEVAKALQGNLAVDNTRLAYQDYVAFFESDRFKKLVKLGAQKQRPLWASTSTKNPVYSDIKYVEELVAENSVNTIPLDTLDAYLDHGQPRISIFDNLDRAEKNFQELKSLEISLDGITQELEDEGVSAFTDSYNTLIATIEERRDQFLAGLGSLAGSVVEQVTAVKRDNLITKIFLNDPSVWSTTPEAQKLIQKRMGWLYLPLESLVLVDPLTDFARKCQNDGYEKCVLLGMGGSSLAPETMHLIFGQSETGLSLKILDSTIPEQIREVESWLEYEKTLFIVASKSGTTTETLSLFHYFWKESKQINGDQCGAHFVAITDPGSQLDQLGMSLNFREVFTANPNVGGRYSALTHFGLVPAALMGIALNKLIENAHRLALNNTLHNQMDRNLSALLGIILGKGALEGKNKLTILADSSYSPLGAWLEQLIAESSGKQGKGIIPITDEPLMEVQSYSSDRLFVYLRGTGDMDNLVKKLQGSGHPVVVLQITSSYDLAAHFYYWEFAVALACSILGVNPFDQPDVHSSKDRTKAKLATFIDQGTLEGPQVTWEKEGVSVYGLEFEALKKCHSIYDVITEFTALSRQGDYIAINAYLPRNNDTLTKLNRLRERILNRSGCATTLGFGPRFLHSTGQLHKGGPNNGLFIQITQENAIDLEVPGTDYTFGVLAQAQALGDLEALQEKGRRVLRIHLPVDDSLDF